MPLPGDLPSRAKIHALQSGSSIGGLLSLGTWSTQTLATFTLSGTASSFTLSSSRGSCGVSSGSFSCGSGVSPTSFSAVSFPPPYFKISCYLYIFVSRCPLVAVFSLRLVVQRRFQVTASQVVQRLSRSSLALDTPKTTRSLSFKLASKISGSTSDDCV